MIQKLQKKFRNKIRLMAYNYEILNIKEKNNLAKLNHNRLDLLQMIESIQAYIKNFDVLVDVGANEGGFAECLAWFVPFSEAILVEPNSGLNETIKRNTSDIKAVAIINKALSDEVKECNYYFHLDSQMNSLIGSNSAALDTEFGDKEIDAQKIFTSTLDAEMAAHFNKFNNKKVFLKLDTQGNEIDILKGATETLKRTSYCLIEFMSNSPYERKNSLEDIIFAMHSAGFTCIGPVYLKKRKNFEVGATNFLFIKY